MHKTRLKAGTQRIVTAAIREYVGPAFALVEAKGWKSLPTRRDFHGWHGDAWYDQEQVQGIPREVKLGLYLTGVHISERSYLLERAHEELAKVRAKG